MLTLLCFPLPYHPPLPPPPCASLVLLLLPLHVTAATAEVTLAGRRAAAPLSSELAKN